VLDCYRRMADEQREAWIALSWDAGDANPDLLIELRTRADAYLVRKLVAPTADDLRRLEDGLAKPEHLRNIVNAEAATDAGVFVNPDFSGHNALL